MATGWPSRHQVSPVTGVLADLNTLTKGGSLSAFWIHPLAARACKPSARAAAGASLLRYATDTDDIPGDPAGARSVLPIKVNCRGALKAAISGGSVDAVLNVGLDNPCSRRPWITSGSRQSSG